MPIYAYQCQSCGHEFDALRKLSDPPLEDCPACGKAEVRKLLTAPSFRLSGSGWYETDFKTGNKKNLAGEHGATSGGATPESSPSTAPGKGSGDTAAASA